MPLFRFEHRDAPDEVAKLEAEGYTLVGISDDDAGIYIAMTKPGASERADNKGVETRTPEPTRPDPSLTERTR